MPIVTPEISDVLRSHTETRLGYLWTALVGTVQSFNASKQTVDVKPGVKGSTVNESGDRVAESIAVIPAVPVLFLGGGKFRTTYPIQTGDTCLLICCSQQIHDWMAGSGQEVDPEDDRRQSLSDCVALVGLRPAGLVLSDVPGDTMSVGLDGGPTAEFSSTDIQAGGSNELALKTDMAALGALIVGMYTAVSAAGSVPIAQAEAMVGAFIAWYSALPGSNWVGPPPAPPTAPTGTSILKGG